MTFVGAHCGLGLAIAAFAGLYILMVSGFDFRPSDRTPAAKSLLMALLANSVLAAVIISAAIYYFARRREQDSSFADNDGTMRVNN